jgi:prophage regulatory protein
MRFLRKPEAAARVGYHPEHVMRLVRQDKFPKPVQLGPKSIAFIEEEVEAWMAERVAERDAEPVEESAQK